MDDMSWSTSTCWGHNEEDVTVWHAGFEGGSTETRYTNADLMVLFDPTNSSIPYVYDNFEWPHGAHVGRPARRRPGPRAERARRQRDEHDRVHRPRPDAAHGGDRGGGGGGRGRQRDGRRGEKGRQGRRRGRRSARPGGQRGPRAPGPPR